MRAGEDAGGNPEAEGADSESTTGAGQSGVFVGPTAGQDEGYAGPTGAEARDAEQSRDPGDG